MEQLDKVKKLEQLRKALKKKKRKLQKIDSLEKAREHVKKTVEEQNSTEMCHPRHPVQSDEDRKCTALSSRSRSRVRFSSNVHSPKHHGAVKRRHCDGKKQPKPSATSGKTSDARHHICDDAHMRDPSPIIPKANRDSQCTGLRVDSQISGGCGTPQEDSSDLSQSILQAGTSHAKSRDTSETKWPSHITQVPVGQSETLVVSDDSLESEAQNEAFIVPDSQLSQPTLETHDEACPGLFRMPPEGDSELHRSFLENKDGPPFVSSETNPEMLQNVPGDKNGMYDKSLDKEQSKMYSNETVGGDDSHCSVGDSYRPRSDSHCSVGDSHRPRGDSHCSVGDSHRPGSGSHISRIDSHCNDGDSGNTCRTPSGTNTSGNCHIDPEDETEVQTTSSCDSEPLFSEPPPHSENATAKSKSNRKPKSRRSEMQLLDFSFLEEEEHDMYSQIKSRSRKCRSRSLPGSVPSGINFPSVLAGLSQTQRKSRRERRRNGADVSEVFCSGASAQKLLPHGAGALGSLWQDEAVLVQVDAANGAINHETKRQSVPTAGELCLQADGEKVKAQSSVCGSLKQTGETLRRAFKFPQIPEEHNVLSEFRLPEHVFLSPSSNKHVILNDGKDFSQVPPFTNSGTKTQFFKAQPTSNQLGSSVHDLETEASTSVDSAANEGGFYEKHSMDMSTCGGSQMLFEESQPKRKLSSSRSRRRKKKLSSVPCAEEPRPCGPCAKEAIQSVMCAETPHTSVSRAEELRPYVTSVVEPHTKVACAEEASVVCAEEPRISVPCAEVPSPSVTSAEVRHVSMSFTRVSCDSTTSQDSSFVEKPSGVVSSHEQNIPPGQQKTQPRDNSMPSAGQDSQPSVERSLEVTRIYKLSGKVVCIDNGILDIGDETIAIVAIVTDTMLEVHSLDGHKLCSAEAETGETFLEICCVEIDNGLVVVTKATNGVSMVINSVVFCDEDTCDMFIQCISLKREEDEEVLLAGGPSCLLVSHVTTDASVTYSHSLAHERGGVVIDTTRLCGVADGLHSVAVVASGGHASGGHASGGHGAVVGVSPETLYIWDQAEGTLVQRVDLDIRTRLCSAVYEEQGLLFMVLWDEKINAWHIIAVNPWTSKHCVMVTSQHTSQCGFVKMTSCAEHVMCSLHENGSLQLWNIDTAENLKTAALDSRLADKDPSTPEGGGISSVSVIRSSLHIAAAKASEVIVYSGSDVIHPPEM